MSLEELLLQKELVRLERLSQSGASASPCSAARGRPLNWDSMEIESLHKPGKLLVEA